MKKTIWTTFGIALVLVNVIAEVGYYYTDIYIDMFFRIAVIVGITTVASIFAGSIILVNKLEQEKPLSGHVSNTLGADRKKAEE